MELRVTDFAHLGFLENVFNVWCDQVPDKQSVGVSEKHVSRNSSFLGGVFAIWKNEICGEALSKEIDSAVVRKTIFLRTTSWADPQKTTFL